MLSGLSARRKNGDREGDEILKHAVLPNRPAVSPPHPEQQTAANCMTAILVPDAQTRAGIAAIRSLGSAGYRVHAVSPYPKALGLRSKFARHRAVSPRYRSPQFVDWLRAYVAQHDIGMIVPTGGLLFGLRGAFDEFQPLLPVMSDPDRLYRCFSKTAVFEDYAAAEPSLRLLENHPRSSVVSLSETLEPQPLPAADAYFIKAEGPRNDHDDSDAPTLAYARNEDEAQQALRRLAAHWTTALVQEACPGTQVGVSVLMDDGKALAVSCVRDCHSRPHSKGTMSLRESCWIPEIAEDAVRRLSYLGWRGCAMVEYRQDQASKRFHIIEINFRYWQYLHLDLYAGMDFPRMQAEWFLDGRTEFEARPVLGVVSRDTWPGEVAQLVNEYRRKDIGTWKKAAATLGFVGRFFNPRIRQDFAFPGDRKLLWLNMLSYMGDEYHSIRRKLDLP